MSGALTQETKRQRKEQEGETDFSPLSTSANSDCVPVRSLSVLETNQERSDDSADFRHEVAHVLRSRIFAKAFLQNCSQVDEE